MPASHKGKLPIMIWIYGGGWVYGGSSPSVYDGSFAGPPHSDVWAASDFKCQRLARGLYLLTYTLLQDNAAHPADNCLAAYE